MIRFIAYTIIFLSLVIGGGSLLLFYAFIIFGPFTFIRFDISELNSLVFDGLLSLLFFIQHSGMIRGSFRTWLSLSIPRYYHSAIYSIASGVALIVMVLFWQTSPTIIYQIHGILQVIPWAITILAILGFIWGVRALGAFDPFGKIPIIVQLRGEQLQTSDCVIKGPYLWVRHPLYFYMLVLIWSTPELRVDRLLFNVLWTVWVILGTYLEERDLVTEFGDKYRQYQKIVPMLIPWRGPVGRNLNGS
ncbi:MAG: isoprenylcysteine carboxylmethyltransferase family protein [bacterium]